jgi:hypothetical protein
LWIEEYLIIQRTFFRVSWSEPKETAEDDAPKKTDLGQENPKSVSVYIAFNSIVPNLMINDESLRVVFARFGGLEDVSIKQSVLDRQTQCQRGYAFVCFEPNDEGMRAALNAASALADCHIDGVHYRCELSNTLRNKLSPSASMHGSPHTSAQTPFAAAPMNNVFVPPPMVPMNQMIPPPQFVPIARAPVPMSMQVPMQNMHMMGVSMPSPPQPSVQQGMNWSGQQVMPQMMGHMGQYHLAQPQMVAPQNMGHQVPMYPQGPSHWQAQFRRESPSGSPGFPGHPSLSSHSSDTMSSGGMMRNQLPSPFAPNQPMVAMNPSQQMQAHGQAPPTYGYRVQPSQVPVYAPPQQQMMPQGQPMPVQMHVFSAPPMQSMHQGQPMPQQTHYGGNYMSH